MTQEKREPGYYWVRKDNSWVISQYGRFRSEPSWGHIWEYCWLVVGHGHRFKDSDWDEIGSRITPEQKYTEEDLRDAWYWGRNYEKAEEFSAKVGCENNAANFEDWLKERE